MGALHRSFLFGLGLFALGREITGRVIKQVVDKAQGSRRDLATFISAVVAKGQREDNVWRERTDESVKRLLEATNLATRTDIRRLEGRVKTLEHRIERLKDQG